MKNNNWLHPERLLYAVAFAALFSVLGYFIPNIYYHYFDKTEYYFVEQPVSTDKKSYEPCEDIKIIWKRTSLIPLQLHFVKNLVKVNGTTIIKRVSDFEDLNQAIPISKDQIVVIDHQLPCDIGEGTYYWQFVVSYKVSDITKTYSIISSLFQIDATNSAKLTK